MIIYIKELDKNDKISFLDKYPKFLHSFVLKFKKVILNNIDNEHQIIILTKINEKTINKVVKVIEKKKIKIRRKIEVVLSEKIKKYSEKFKEISVLDGKSIYISHVEDVIKNILGDKPIEMQDIYFLSNSYNSTNVNIIEALAPKAKSVNIITKNIEKYNILENMLLEQGIIVTVLNNKKKSLKKAKLIINIDFTGEEIKNYSIYRKACIVNLNDVTIKKLQCFEGIVINGIELDLPEEQFNFFKTNNMLSDFSKISLYESIKQEKKKISISKIYGNNGEISKKERLNVQNILTN